MQQHERAMETETIQKNGVSPKKLNRKGRGNFLIGVMLLLAFCGFTSQVMGQTYSGGSGTENDPYLIFSKADMETLAAAVNGGNNYSQGKYFLLTQNLNGITTSIGSNSTTESFQGIFDGGGYTISINSGGGIFLCIFSATVKNLNVSGAINIAVVYNSSSYAVGGICHSASNSTISNCHSNVSIYAESIFNGADSYTGGICGDAAVVTIENCYNSASISGSYAGGICGKANASTISNCYNTAIIQTTSYQCGGGICGQITSSTIESCYNLGNLTTSYCYLGLGGICGNSDVFSILKNSVAINPVIVSTEAYGSGTWMGKIIGSGNGTMNNCYALSTMQVYVANSGQMTLKQGGLDIDIASFQSQEWITDNLQWDFVNTWYMPSTSDYPLLKKAPNIRASKSSIIYGETTTILSNNTNAAITYSLSDNTVASIQGNTITPLKAGTVTITASQAGTTEYQSESKEILLIVNKKEVTVTANNSSMFYGDTPPAFTCQYNGFVNGDTETVLTTYPTMNCNATSTSNVGDYSIIPSGAVAQNYTFTYQNGTLTINKRQIQITPNNATRTYGSANPTFTFTYTGFANNETDAVISISPTATTTASITSNAGNYPITCSGGNADNYSFTYGTGTLTVTKASLTAVADNKSRPYGANNPELTITYYGFRNSDNQSALIQAPYAICQATQTSSLGDYPIVLSGGDAENYDFTLMNGTLTIIKATVTVTALSASSVYGDNPPAFNCQYSGFKNDDTETVLTTLPVMSCSANSTSNVGNYPIVPSGATAQNYSFTYQSGTLTIGKRQIQAIPDNAQREYGNDNPSFSISFSGFVNSDDQSSIAQYPTATTVANLTSNAGDYSITGSGGNADNYSFSYGTGTLTITKAPLTIAAYNSTRTQGQPNPIFTFTYSGFKNNENYSVLDELPVATCAADEKSIAGYYEIVLSGGYDKNYNYTLVNGTLEVTAPASIENISSNDMAVYPNPVKSELFIKSELPIKKVEICSLTGVLLLSESNFNEKISVSSLLKGIYLVKIYTDKGLFISKTAKE